MSDPSIYSAIVFDLHPKVKEYIDTLNQTGQIDHDSDGHPYVIDSTRVQSNISTKISRNNQVETFVLHPRKKADPIISWNPHDGFVRPAQKKKSVGVDKTPDRRERAMRVVSMEQIVETILEE